MFRPLRTLLFLAALAALLDSVSACANEADVRLIREAKELFRVIKSGELAPKKERCSVASVWSTYTVPEHIAHAQFGLTLHADLAAPSQRSTPFDAFDFGENYKGSFCDPKENEAYRAERLLAFEASQDPSLHLSTADLTFPIFNAAYNKAIIIYSGVGYGWYRNKSGVHNLDLNVGSDAIIYRKLKGHWRETARISLGIS